MKKDSLDLGKIILMIIEVVIALILFISPIVRVQMWYFEGEWSYLSTVQGLFQRKDPYGIGADLTDQEFTLIGLFALYITATIILCIIAAYQIYKDNLICVFVGNALTIILVAGSFIVLLYDLQESSDFSGSLSAGYWLALVLAIAGIVLAAKGINNLKVNNWIGDPYEKIKEGKVIKPSKSETEPSVKEKNPYKERSSETVTKDIHTNEAEKGDTYRTDSDKNVRVKYHMKKHENEDGSEFFSRGDDDLL